MLLPNLGNGWKPDVGPNRPHGYNFCMVDADDRAQLVLRVWGSFIAGLLLVGLVGGLYDYFAHGLVVTGLGFPVVGFAVGLPFLVAAGLGAYSLAPFVVRHPALWSGAAAVVASSLCFLLFPERTWLAALIVSVIAGIVFCTWLASRPIGTN